MPPQANPPRSTRPLLRIGTPIALSGLSFALMSATDTAFVSELGVHALAGVGLAGTLAFTALMPALGLFRAAKIRIAEARGAGEEDAGYAGASLKLVALLALPGTLMLVGLGALSPWLTATDAAAGAAQDYLWVRALATPPFMLALALREIFYGRGNTRTPLLAVVVANVVNVAMNYLGVVILGWGVVGVAASTVVAVSVQASILFLAMRPEGFGWGRDSATHWAKIRQIGVPFAAQRFVESLAFAFIASMVARVGDGAAAAHQLAIQLLLLGNLPSVALGDATTILAARAYGGGERGTLRTLGADALRIGFVWSLSVCFVAWMIVPWLAPRLAPEAVTEVILATRTCGLLLILEASSVVAQGLLRATGDPRFPSVVVTLNASLIGPALCFFAIHSLGWGAMAAWSAFCVEVLFTTTLLWGRVRWRMPRPMVLSS